MALYTPSSFLSALLSLVKQESEIRYKVLFLLQEWIILKLGNRQQVCKSMIITKCIWINNKNVF